MIKHIFFIAFFATAFQFLSFGQGSQYSGSYTNSSPISWNGQSNKTISNLAIVNSGGHCIELNNCSNITIQNCKLGPSKNEGVYMYNCKNITVINCTLDHNDTGVFAGLSSGISVTHNDVINVQGPMPRGQMVQFDEVTGNGNSISFNVVENILGQSHPEDAISLFKSSGKAGDPIRVVGNWIRGGGPSNSGGGIMTGDMGGSYILVQDNILVNPGQYGATIASGNNIAIKNNKIYSKQLAFSNIGLSAYKQYAIASHSDTIMNNTVNFTYMDGQLNNLLNDGKFGEVVGWSTNKYDPNLNENILPEKIIGRAKSITTETITPASNADIKIYPNPAYDHLSVESATDLENGNVIIYNISGQKIIEQSLTGKTNDINTANLPIGVYIVKISANNQVIDQKKIMIRKN